MKVTLFDVTFSDVTSGQLIPIRVSEDVRNCVILIRK